MKQAAVGVVGLAVLLSLGGCNKEIPPDVKRMYGPNIKLHGGGVLSTHFDEHDDCPHYAAAPSCQAHFKKQCELKGTFCQLVVAPPPPPPVIPDAFTYRAVVEKLWIPESNDGPRDTSTSTDSSSGSSSSSSGGSSSGDPYD